MSLAIVYSRASQGVSAPLVTVEVHVSNGLPGMAIVGLPEKAVKESKDRVRSALINSRFCVPARRITINLAPADLPKEGAAYDLAIAMGILVASEQLPCEPIEKFEFLGELALNGELRPVRAALPAALAIHKAGRKLIVSANNPDLQCLSEKHQVFLANHLLEVTAHFSGTACLKNLILTRPTERAITTSDLAEVRGQAQAKRALEIAAAGGHSLLFVGPPGTGKSMLSSRLPTILPNMSEEQALDVAAIYSVAKKDIQYHHWRERPYRAPHHTSSAMALIGGGRPPQPGEVSLAHQGVLFLDELPEFGRHVLEVLREPLESGHVNISRAAYQATFPAEFQLIAAMNPCPCGYFGTSGNQCQCTDEMVSRYKNKISGPLMDRIDMQTAVNPIPRSVLLDSTLCLATETSRQVQQRVQTAYDKQMARQDKPNARLSQSEIHEYCKLSNEDIAYLSTVLEQLKLSARAYYRLLKVARTIADLADQPMLTREYLQEAMSYRK
ncbi:MAG: hypothetical protein A3F17_02290 [Gammaproteobacteria bacterium RIFCSPHIGHO2_12_FULL_41_15]|nr:MAG: hypothetical protein A3F17_02290 [Gammaproteobacteria bacterium RIFCSPHIGHO2_12_FULL_41_15]